MEKCLKGSKIRIEPNDSASNVSKRSHKSCRPSSHSSYILSSVSSMKIKVAALLAHKAALKQKHALEMEKAALTGNSKLGK